LGALFTPEELDNARWHLENAGFPLSSEAAELHLLNAAEPFHAYTFAASACLKAFEDHEDSRKLIETARKSAEVIDRIEQWVNESLASEGEEPVQVACKAGCNFCCFIRVSALAPEALRIADHIEKHFTKEVRDETLISIDRFLAIATTMTPRERFLKPTLCPLNKNGLCTVYDVRPAACRSHHSYSVEQCQIAFDDWEKEHPIIRSAMRKYCSEAIVLALSDVLDFLEIDPRSLELPEALKIALETPGAEPQCRSGEDVFGAAYLEDVHEVADARFSS